LLSGLSCLTKISVPKNSLSLLFVLAVSVSSCRAFSLDASCRERKTARLERATNFVFLNL